jgi:thioredoxin-dependent peroxiredoxin
MGCFVNKIQQILFHNSIKPFVNCFPEAICVMKRNKNLVTIGGTPVTLLGKQLKPNMQAKNFFAVYPDLSPMRLSDFAGKVRIISSVSSVDTDVCGEQTKRFNLEASKMPDVQVITISCDLPFALKRFCSGEGINNLVTVSDHKSVDFGIKYGFLIEEHRTLARGIIIIDQTDLVRYVELVREVGDHPNYDKALRIARDLL